MNCSIFVYGSLMEKEEIETILNDDVNCHKVKVHGFARDYSKIAHSWGPENEDTGVLGLIKDKDEWCNGILVTNVDEQSLDNYYLREVGVPKSEYEHGEFGYNIVEIDSECIEFYNGEKNIREPIYTSITNKRLDEPNTHNSYRRLCENAAKQYGSEFLDDFNQTTSEFHN